jgi:hypothetical protein
VAATARKVARAVTPAPLLDAGDGYLDRRAGRHDDGRVDDAVLLRADEHLAVDDDDVAVGRVFDEEAGDAAALRDLRDFDQPARERLLEFEQRQRRGLASYEDRRDLEPPDRDGLARV